MTSSSSAAAETSPLVVPSNGGPQREGCPAVEVDGNSSLPDASRNFTTTTSALHGDATVFQTVLNMAKTCCGTGCLVLPFAAKQGGLWLHSVGMLAIALWNVYTVQRLCSCLQYLPLAENSHTHNNNCSEQHTSPIIRNSRQEEREQNYGSGGERSLSLSPIHRHGKHSTAVEAEQIPLMAPPPLTTEAPRQKSSHAIFREHPPEGTAMFGQVVFYAVGWKGLWALDLLMVSFLMGILVTYINAMRSFLRDTPLSTGSNVLDALALAAILGPLSSVPHMGYLAKASAMGLLVLALTFVVIAIYGLDQYNDDENHSGGQATFSTKVISLSWFPQNGLWGISHWFGCVVFSFGVAPLTYNFRSSMARPHQMVTATIYALVAVAVAYMVVGIGFWKLFPKVDSDLLQELPTTGMLPIMTRLAMVVVVLTTAPFLIVPCGELLEGKMLPASSSSSAIQQQQPAQHHVELYHHTRRVILFRFGISLIGVAISLYVPGFVNVLAFVGCCCVACLGFCIPPLVHALLSYQARHYKPVRQSTVIVDVVMLTWGIFATVVSTTYTFRQLSVGGAGDNESG